MAKVKEKLSKEDAVQKFYDWFDADRNAKATIQEELEECYKIYNGSHWDLKDPIGRPLRSAAQKANHPNTVENFTFSLVEGLVAEFCEDVDLIDYPVEPGDDDAANVFTELKKYIMYKNKIKPQREDYVRNFFLYGTAIWHIYWDPLWKGGKGPNRWVGDIRWVSAHPQAIYPDLRCRKSIEEGTRIHKAVYRTREYVEEKYGVEVEADTTTELYIIGDETERMPDSDNEEVLLVETWYKGKPKILDKDEKDEGYGMHVVWWAGENNPTYLAHANYVYYEPEEDVMFPFSFRQRYPRENSVWGYGEAHFLKSPQIVLNKTTELILEGHMHYSMGQTFYKPGAITPRQEAFLKKFGTMPGMYFPVTNLDDVKRIHGKGVDASLPAEATRVQRTMESIIGRHDISQGRTPGSVVAFRALDLLAARARIRLRSAENALMSAYEDCGNYINNLITQFYTEERAYRILGDGTESTEYFMYNPETGEEMPFLNAPPPPGWVIDTRKTSNIKYGMFKLDDYLKVYVYDTATGMSDVFPYDEDMQETITMVEGLKDEAEETGDEFEPTLEYEVYCPQFDTKCKVSTASPTDRAFYMEMAKELLMGQVIDDETFWYVLQNGKFPPYEEIMRKRKEELMAAARLEQQAQEQQMMMQQQQAQMQQQQPQGEMPMEAQPLDGAIVEQVFANRPDLLQKFQQLSPEAQQQVLAELQQGNINM